MSLVLVALVLVALTSPAVALRRVPLAEYHPVAAATICLAALALRALLVVLGAILIALWLPATSLFALLTHWCWHAVMPLITAHLGLSGHRLGDAATLAPTMALAVSLLSLVWGVARAARSLRRLLGRRPLSGPLGSVVVGGPEVLVAAAGLVRPRVVVSAGALTALDDEELAAGVEHERGHIARRHRFAVLVAEVIGAVARPFPGARALLAEFLFHLERDADAYALARRHDPLALASAICKAATCESAQTPLLLALGGSRGSIRRVNALAASPARERRARSGWSLAGVLAAIVVALSVALPSAAVADLDRLPPVPSTHACPA